MDHVLQWWLRRCKARMHDRLHLYKRPQKEVDEPWNGINKKLWSKVLSTKYVGGKTGRGDDLHRQIGRPQPKLVENARYRHDRPRIRVSESTQPVWSKIRC